MDAADAVLTFLRSVGENADAEYYLRMFRAAPRERFAAIAVDAATMAQASDAVALDLRFLSQLELTPVVLLGLREPDDAARDAHRLAALLSSAGVDASDAHAGDTHDLAAITSDARAGRIPIVTLSNAELGAREAALTTLLTQLDTRKLIFLRNRGGLRLHGRRLSVVNLSDELQALTEASEFDLGDRRLLDLSSRLLAQPGLDELLVSLTSPINLLHELFTVKGAGTLLRRGTPIARHTGLEGVERGRLERLLSESFGRPLHPQLLDRPLAHTYLEGRYRAAALLTSTEGFGYLTKFAVTRRAQGEGLGRDLWQAIATDYPRLVWRARPGNPITPWYEAHCDGRLRTDEWTVYFRGIATDAIGDAIEYALAQPEDFA